VCSYDRNRRSHPVGVTPQRVTEISPRFGSRDYLVAIASSRLPHDQAPGMSRCPGCGVGGAGVAGPGDRAQSTRVSGASDNSRGLPLRRIPFRHDDALEGRGGGGSDSVSRYSTHRRRRVHCRATLFTACPACGGVAGWRVLRGWRSRSSTWPGRGGFRRCVPKA
jgi:hypothetical protein